MHDTRIHAELCLHKLGARIDLGLQPCRFPSRRRIDRVVGTAEKEIKIAADLPASGKLAYVPQASRGIEQRARIEIKDRLGVGLIPGARIVTTQHQEIAYARRRRAQQIALQRNSVAIAASQLKDGL